MERTLDGLRAAGNGRTKPRQVADDLNALQRLLAFLKVEGRLFRNPLAGVLSPAQPGLQERVVGGDDIRRWLAILTDSEREPMLRVIGLLAILHGLNSVEMSELRMGDFQPRARKLHVRRRRLALALDPLTHDALVA